MDVETVKVHSIIPMEVTTKENGRITRCTAKVAYTMQRGNWHTKAVGIWIAFMSTVKFATNSQKKLPVNTTILIFGWLGRDGNLTKEKSIWIKRRVKANWSLPTEKPILEHLRMTWSMVKGIIKP